MRWRLAKINWIVLLLVTGAIAFLSARSFGHKNHVQTGGPFSDPNDFVIQVDDYGSFWDPLVPATALERIARESRDTNTVVVLFVHGWHHNAAADDDNAKDFARSLAEVRATLDDNQGGKPGIYRQSRQRLTGNGNVKVIGIYIGWRGKSLPMPLDYLTFWGRKAAAERVGRGDLREFLLRLNNVYRDRNSAHQGERKSSFMGMVTFGHSFGGQVLFTAVAGTLEQELIQATSPSPAGQGRAETANLTGFGDIVVLVNPALEAFQYERIHTLNRQLRYDRRQTPLLFVLSSETDFARQIFFPAGRWLDALFRAPFRDGQARLWKEALGEYEPQRTHSVEILPPEERKQARFDPSTYTNDPCGIVNFDLTNVPAIGGVRLSPTKDHQVFSPFLVVYASGKIIIQHSGIFEETLRDFLNDYVAITEGKRILLADRHMQECLNPLR